MMTLVGKNFIVTGGGSGIGRAATLILANAGANVMIGDLNKAGLKATVDLGSGAPGKILTQFCDVTSEEQIIELVEAAVSRFGALHGSCNAAGIPNLTKPLHEIHIDEWSKSVAVNLTGVFLCMKYEISAMLKTGGGSIVNVSSTAGIRGYPGAAEYCASKAGVTGLARSSVADYGKVNIRVNTVLPGPTKTPMFQGSMSEMPGMEDILAQQHPRGRFGEPDEVANAIVWLLSDASSYVSGTTMPVDGGHTVV